MPEEKNEKEKKPENRNPQNKKTTDNTAQKKKDHRKFHHKKKPKPPAAPDGSKENAANSTPSAATQATPTAQRQTEKKEPKKPGDRRPPSNSRGGAKPVDAKPVEQIKNYFGIEIGEPKNTTDWLEEDIGRYHRAVMAALGKSPVSPEGLLDLSEIWISTSLPLDLIIEVIQTQGLGENLGEVKSVIFQGRKIWPLPKPVEKDD